MKTKIKTTAILLTTAVGLSFSLNARAADNPALMPPVKTIFDRYLKIQNDLANDSLKGLATEAGAIAKVVQGGGMKIPKTVATEARTLARTTDLKSARAAFKPLSDSLIKYLADHNAKNAYVEIYCPMAKASWLQTNRVVGNPYLGRDMPTCGVIKN